MSMNPRSSLGLTERAYCEVVKGWMDATLKPKFETCHLEITGDKPISNSLQNKIAAGRDIVLAFINEARPDVTGFVKRKGSPTLEFIVAEVKLSAIKLDDIYQVRKYADLHDARFAFLVSPVLPEKIVRLAAVTPSLLGFPQWRRKVTLVRLSEDGRSAEWTEDPSWEN